HNGYTRLPNGYLMRMVAGELQRSEIQVVLLIARFTISFQRKHAPLSKTVLERQTGLSGPGVLQAVSSLLAKGLIEKIPGDQHRPNQLGLVFGEDWDFFSTPPKGKSLVPTVIPVTEVTPVPPQTSGSVTAVTPAEAIPVTDFKRDSTITKQTLSPLPLPLQKYFDQLKPAKKRESEWRAFKALRADYSDQDIADCLELLLERGIGSGDSAQPCHSPMAFLSKAIDSILPVLQAKRQKRQMREERELFASEAERLRNEAEAREAVEWQAKEKAFCEAFPTEDSQTEVLAKLLGNLPFRPNTKAGRTAGISRWSACLCKSEETDSTQNDSIHN
ncbi:MAG: helix-turn-helix domain-containing protein, partial [Bdellovibrionota bacterium]